MGVYNYPPISLLKEYTSDDIFMDQDRAKKIAKILMETCWEFSLGASIDNISTSSMSITISVRPEIGTSLKSFTNLKVDFEVRLASQIEINASTEREGIIDFVIKNMNRPLVGIRSIIESDEFQRIESPLTIAAGVDIRGRNLCFDLAEAPHMLIAGATGSGKTVFIDDILTSILFKASPEDVQLILMDPKRVELSLYNGIPHLKSSVVYDMADFLDSFLWVEDEIIKRYDLFSRHGVKNIDKYNSNVGDFRDNKLPRIVVIIDEFSDMVMSAPTELHNLVDRIARLGRGAGIHLILATQLPVAKIVTPQIKANIPFRAAFTIIDSKEAKVVMDKTGAERLMGNGDMLISAIGRPDPIHAQAAYVSETEITQIVEYVKGKA